MPFRFQGLSGAIPSGRLSDKESRQVSRSSTTQGAAAAGKVLASNWVRGGINSPSKEAAAPWFTEEQPFSQLRQMEPQRFDEWGARFQNATNIGYEFRPPQPEPTNMGDQTAPNNNAGNNGNTDNRKVA